VVPLFRGFGDAPSENFDILYCRSCILGHFKACFEGNNFIFCQAEKNIFLFKVMQTLHHKIKSKIIENLPFCIKDIFFTNKAFILSYIPTVFET